MTSAPVLTLPEFLTARRDPRTLLLDCRLPNERASSALTNPYFTVVYAPHTMQRREYARLAHLLGGRHGVAVGVTEADAAVVAESLCDLDARAAVLQGGMAGWNAAVIEEPIEFRGDVGIVGMLRISSGLRSYILTEAREAIVIDPSGCVDCFIAEIEALRCRPIAVVESGERGGDSCAPELCAILGAARIRADRAEAFWTDYRARHSGMR